MMAKTMKIVLLALITGGMIILFTVAQARLQVADISDMRRLLLAVAATFAIGFAAGGLIATVLQCRNAPDA